MTWPAGPDYQEAIQGLDASMADEELRAGEVARNRAGLPIPWSGGFADVYKVHCPATGNTWAVKCFTREVPGLRERYRQIADHLEKAQLPFTVDFQYLQPGIRVRGEWFPALKMRWIEGLRLNEFIEQYLDQPKTLKMLLELWVKMSARLRQAQMAHADLQHGNVLLVPMSTGQLALRLIDYDGMYVPSLAGTRSAELGQPNYQHPQRLREGTYSAEVDRFSHLAIYSAIRCLTVRRQLWQEFGAEDSLLFRAADFADPGSSDVFRRLWALPDADARSMAGRLAMACRQPLDEAPLLEELVTDGRVVPLGRQERMAVDAMLAPRRPAPARPAESSGPKPEVPAGAATRPAEKATQPAGQGPRLDGRKRKILVGAAAAGVLAVVAILAIVFRGSPREQELPVASSADGPPAVADDKEAAGTPANEASQQAPDPGSKAAESAVYTLQLFPGASRLRVAVGNATLAGTGWQRTLTIDQPQLNRQVLVIAECDGFQRAEKWLNPLPGLQESVSLSLDRAPTVQKAAPLPKRPPKRPKAARRAANIASGSTTPAAVPRAETLPAGPLALLDTDALWQWKVANTPKPIREVLSFEAKAARFVEQAGIWHPGMNRFPDCVVDLEYRCHPGAVAWLALKAHCSVQVGMGNTGLLSASEGKTFKPLAGQNAWNDTHEGRQVTSIAYLGLAEKPEGWNAMRIALQGKRWRVSLNDRLVNDAECSITGGYPFWVNGAPGFEFRNVRVAPLAPTETPLDKTAAPKMQRTKAFVFGGQSAIVTPVERVVPVTVEAWVWIDPAPQSTDMFVIGSDDLDQGTGLGLRVGQSGSPGGKRTHADVNMTGFWAATRVPNKTWAHLAATFDYQEARLFLNGAMVHKDKLFEHRGRAPFVVGYIGYGKYRHPQCFFVGKMRAVRITAGIRYREAFVPDLEFKKVSGEKGFRTILIYDPSKTRRGIPMDLTGGGNDGQPMNVRIEDVDFPEG